MSCSDCHERSYVWSRFGGLVGSVYERFYMSSDFLFLLRDPVKLQIIVPTTIQSNKLVLKFHAGGTVTSTSEGTSKSNMVSSDLTWQLLFSHYDSKRNHLCQLQEGCSRPVAQNPSKWFDCEVNLEFRWFFCLNPFSPSSLNQSPNTWYET